MRRLASSQIPSLNTVLTHTGHVLQVVEATIQHTRICDGQNITKKKKKKISTEQRKQVYQDTCATKIQLISLQRCSSLVTIRQQSFIYVINYWAPDLHTITAWLISSFTLEFTWEKPLCGSECLTFSIWIRSPTQIYTHIHTQKWYSLLPPT